MKQQRARRRVRWALWPWTMLLVVGPAYGQQAGWHEPTLTTPSEEKVPDDFSHFENESTSREA